jgi:DNA polymerase III subunit beta
MPRKKSDSPDYDVAVQKGTLARALGQCVRVVPDRPTLPVLSNVLLRAESGQLRLTATNLDVSISEIIEAEVRRPLAISAPAKMLEQSIAWMPEDAMIFMARNDKAEKLHYTVEQPFRRDATLVGIAADDFPLAFFPDLDGGLTLPGAVLREAFGNVEPAIARDQNRPVLSGMHITLAADGRLTLEAADGFRLHVESIQTPLTGQALDIIVPLQAIKIAASIIDREAGVLLALPRENTVVFAQEGWQVASQLIEGTYPDLTHVIPGQASVKITAPSEALRKALRGADVYARQVSYAGRFTAEAGDETAPAALRVSIQSADSGDVHAELDATIDGPVVPFACNTRFLLDALDALTQSQVTLEVTSATSPIKIRQNTFTAVLMPIHIGR